MISNELIYDLVLETKQAVQATKELVEKTKTEAGKSGKQAGDEFGKQFKSALTAITGKISFNFLKNQMAGLFDTFRGYANANLQIEGAVKAVNFAEQARYATVNDSTKSIEQKAIAIGLDTNEIYENTKATKTNQGAIKSLKGDIENKTRAFEDSVRGQEDYVVAQETSKRSTQAQTDTINDQIYALKEQTREQIKAFRIAKGGDVLDTELEKLQIQKNDLEIQRDIAKLNNDGNAFALADNQIKVLDVEISLRQNKLDAIEFETKAIQRQSDIQQEALEKQKVGFEQQIKSITRNIENVRAELDIKKNKFDIDIEPAKRKLEDLQASVQTIDGTQRIKKSVLDQVNEASKQLPRVIKTADFQALREALFAKYEGIVPRQSLATAIADLVKGGLTDVGQVSSTIERFVDIASAGKVAGVSMGSAVEQLGEQFRSERAALGETAGLTEEYISQILPKGLALLQSEGKLKGKRIEDLNTEERALAKQIGLLDMTADRQGKFNDKLEAGLLAPEELDAEFQKLALTLSQTLGPELLKIIKELTPIVAKFLEIVAQNPQLVLSLLAVATGFAGIATVVAGVMAIMPALTFAFTALGGASVLGFLAGALTQVQIAFAMITGISGIGGAITALGMIMSPIGWVVLAIGALTAGVIWAYQNIGWFRDLVNFAFRDIVNRITWATTIASLAIRDISGDIVNRITWATTMASLAIRDISRFISGFNWGDIWQGMLNGFGRAIEGMGKMLQEFFKPENLKKLGNGFMDFIRGLLDGLGAGISGSDKIINPIKDKLPRFATGGSFMVGGKGGVDKNLIQFMATKGERVIIQTPNQQANNVNSGNITTQNFINYGNSGSGYIPSFMTNFG